MNGIRAIGLTLQGVFEQDEQLTKYYMTKEEKEKEKNGDITVVGTTTYVTGKNGEYKIHESIILSMSEVERIHIDYDPEDDYIMDQHFYLKNGEKLYGRSRDHEEVKLWESKGIPITKDTYKYE